MVYDEAASLFGETTLFPQRQSRMVAAIIASGEDFMAADQDPEAIA